MQSQDDHDSLPHKKEEERETHGNHQSFPVLRSDGPGYQSPCSGSRSCSLIEATSCSQEGLLLLSSVPFSLMDRSLHQK